MKETEGVFLTNDEELKKWKIVSLSYMTSFVSWELCPKTNGWREKGWVGGEANSNSENQPN